MTLPQRKDWIRALSAFPPAELGELAGALTAGCEVSYAGLPLAGLGLLTVEDGSLGEAYHLGEFPLSTCRVRLRFPDGAVGEGGAQVLADDADCARSLAILDGILAARLPGWERVQERAVEGARIRAEEDRRRRLMLEATRVDFSMLNNAVGERDDD